MLASLIFPFLGVFLASDTAWAAHTNQAVYEDTFDLAAGGASLTRATQEGMIFANPALLPWGAQMFHWIGLKTTMIVGSDSVALARDAVKGAQGTGAGAKGSDMVNKAFDTPVHMGMASSLSVVTSLFAVSGFARFEPDLSASRYGSTGLPQFTLQAEGYGGMAGALATRIAPWMSVGATVKYLYVAEPFIQADVSEQERIQKLASNPSELKAAASTGKGLGYDVGSLVFLQGRHSDFRWALKIDDVGDTKFTGSQRAFRQTISSGLGVTFHSNSSALHLAADYRDITGAYGESWFKRTYFGSRLTLQKWVGFGAGLYQGYPSYGLIADLLFMRVSLTRYTRELGDHPGVQPRGIYVMSLAFGF